MLFKTKRGRRLRKFQSLLLCITMVVSLIPLIPVATGTSESYAIGEYWAQPYLQDMVDKGIMTGNQNGNLNPSDQITRAEFATMVNRALNFNKHGGTKFGDVNDYDWYYSPIDTASAEGYFQGTGDNNASPNANITREAAVTMLGRALNIQTSPTLSNNFYDDQSISNWSRQYVNAIVAKGIISGYADGSFSPRSNMTRAEVAKLLSSMGGEIVDDGRQERLDYVDGNVTLSASGSGLRNTYINGDLYITDGIDDGHILLDNVTVTGQIIVSGTGSGNSGACSIILRDCDVNELVVDTLDGKLISVATQGNTIIGRTTLRSNAYIENNNTSGTAFTTMIVDMDPDHVANLVGGFNDVIVKGDKNNLNLQKGFITNLTVDEQSDQSKVFLAKNTDVQNLFLDNATEVSGTGSIGTAVITSPGVIIEQLPDTIIIRPGITARINGKDMSYQDSAESNLIPEILAGYPKVAKEDLTSAEATFKANKACKLYWVVIPAGYADPTDAMMINPKLNGSVVASGNQNISSSTDTVIKITGLTQGTDYVVFGMLVDDRNQQSIIKYAEFTTVDSTAPKFTYTYLEAKSREKNDTTMYYVDAMATVSKDATVYYMVLPSGATAPTANDLINQKMTAVDKGSMWFTKSVTSTIVVDGLQENTKYDYYMIAVDNNSRQSAVFKQTITTADTTPPELTSFVDVKSSNSIQFKYVPTEDCAVVYWGIYYTNSPTVATIEKSTRYEADGLLWYETNQDLVIRGTGAIQATGASSKLKATADKENAFNVTNLQSQRYYKIYLVLEDAVGNRSVVYTLDTSTIDDQDPTEELIFGASDGTNLYVGSQSAPTTISIAFSEVVLGSQGDTTKYLNASDMQDLSSWISIYDGDESATKDSSRKLNINWDQVTRTVAGGTGENPEHTVLTFTVSNTTATALQCFSGRTYTFVFNYNAASNIYICDLTGNTMKKIETGSPTGGNYGPVTDTFTCVEPNVTIAAPAGVESIFTDNDGNLHNLDLTYRVTPSTSNDATESDIRYDMYFAADTACSVNIYMQNERADGWTLLAENVAITPDKDMSLEDSISITRAKKGSPVASTDYVDQLFNTMARQYDSGSLVYAFEVVQYNYSTDREAWNGSLTGRFRCVIGEADYLYRKANAPASTAIEVTPVGSADDTVAFTDELPPMLTFEKTNVTESTIDVLVSVDKDVTLYWVAVAGELNANMRKTTQQVYDYIQLKSETDNVYNAEGLPLKLIESSIPITIEGLQPNTNYTVYFVARSKTAAQLSVYDTANAASCVNTNGDKQYVEARTTGLVPPEFQPVTNASTTSYVEIIDAQSDESQMTFRVLTDRPAMIYWTVTTQDNYSLYKSVIDQYPNEIQTPTILSTNGGRTMLEASGSQSSNGSANANGLYETIFNVTGLSSDTRYYVYALAANQLDESIHCTNPEYVSLGSFVLPDKTPPKLTDMSLVFQDASSGITSTKGYAEVLLSFDKTLYYTDSTHTTATKLGTGISNSSFWLISPETATITNMVTGNISTPARTASITPIYGTGTDITGLKMNVDYIDSNSNRSVTVRSNGIYFCNSYGTSAGYLTVTFNVNKSTGALTCTATMKNTNGTTTSSVSATA